MFEQGVIRPPSEAGSLLVRVTRKLPLEPVPVLSRLQRDPPFQAKRGEIKEDIDEMARYHGSHHSRITTAFFQDADSLILPTGELLRFLNTWGRLFPH